MTSQLKQEGNGDLNKPWPQHHSEDAVASNNGRWVREVSLGYHEPLYSSE